MSSRNRYQPAIPLDDLMPNEQAQIVADSDLTWDEIKTAMSFPTQELVDILTAQARIVQMIGVIHAARQLKETNSKLEELRRSHHEIPTGA